MGLWIDAGTRYESPESNGVAHFLEHMIFKVRSSYILVVSKHCSYTCMFLDHVGQALQLHRYQLDDAALCGELATTVTRPVL